MLRKLCFVLVFILAGWNVWSQKSEVIRNSNYITHNIARMIEVLHYQKINFNDSFSNVLYDKAFSDFDPSRILFLQNDLDSLNYFRYRLDNEFNGERPEFYKVLGKLFERRVVEAEVLVKDILTSPLPVRSNKTFIPDRSDFPFPKTIDEKKEIWKDYLTYEYLTLLTDDADSATLSGNIPQAKLDTAFNRLKFSIERRFQQWKDNFSEEIYLSRYLNAMVQMIDPHSGYFLPVERREFEEDLGGVYYGIGALLREANGRVEISELMTGGPAWRSGEIEPGDVFVAIASTGGKFQNVEGMTTQEIIKLTRGQKGTKVMITFRGKDGNLKTVSLTREALFLEDTFTKRAVIGTSDNKLGYIYLPKFYTNFDEESGRSCADDIAGDIQALLKENINGLIIDVRDNGGGSLYEVIKMVGLFVGEKPVVQVKSRDKSPAVANAEGVEQIYFGPLIVLVNERSASAAEIFAAAIQDYQRGIIIGSASTFGKGTVQRTFRVPGRYLSQTKEDLGTVHITNQKYYRVNGGSTQLKGIIPDIILPGYYEYLKLKEDSYPNALPWDKIEKAAVVSEREEKWKSSIMESSRLRRDTVENFITLNKSIELLSKSNASKAYPLDIVSFAQDRMQTREALRLLQSSIRIDIGLPVDNVEEDKIRFAESEQFRKETNKAWLNRIKTDLYLKEAVAVMMDYTKIQSAHDLAR